MISAEQEDFVDVDVLLGVLILRERWTLAWSLLNTCTEDFRKVVLAWRQQMAPGEGVEPVADEIRKDILLKEILEDDGLKTLFMEVLLSESNDVDIVLKYLKLIGGYIKMEQPPIRSETND